MVIFLDTFAIIEIDRGNPNYRKYALKQIDAITTVFNLIEIYFYYLKNYGQIEADDVYKIIKDMAIEIDDYIIKEAGKFKLLHLKKRFSFADCIGYITALKFKAKFLTGDYAFKGLENVEFVR